jgi:NAD(P)-dependent dehydrogenase (short-subunit alcohol dehydrogenase family)
VNRKPEYNLGERTVIITGAAGGIGAATARELVARGASVTLVDLSQETLPPSQTASPPVAHSLTPPMSPASSR